MGATFSRAGKLRGGEGREFEGRGEERGVGAGEWVGGNWGEALRETVAWPPNGVRAPLK